MLTPWLTFWTRRQTKPVASESPATFVFARTPTPRRRRHMFLNLREHRKILSPTQPSPRFLAEFLSIYLGGASAVHVQLALGLAISATLASGVALIGHRRYRWDSAEAPSAPRPVAAK